MAGIADIFSQVASSAPAAPTTLGPGGLTYELPGDKGSFLTRSSSPFGEGSLGKYSFDLQPTAQQQQFADLFGGFSQQAGGQAGQLLGQQNYSAPFDLQQAFGAFNPAQLGQLSQQFGTQAGSLGDYFSGFNINDATQNYLGQLNAAALPAEQTASNSLANRLFSAGRLGSGDTTAGGAFGELAKAQDQAAAQRYLTARQGALTDQNQIANLSQMFAGLSSNLGTQGQANITNMFGSLRADQAQQQDFINNLFNLSSAGQTAGQNAYAPLQQLFQNLLSTRQGSIDQYKASKAAETAAEGASGGLGATFGSALVGAAGTAVGGPIGGALGAYAGGKIGGLIGDGG